MKRILARFTFIFLLTGVFTSWTHRLHGSPQIGIDDANIFFVYASNLAQGHGFVYNIGAEHVEGFTSLLWVVLSAMSFALFSTPERYILVLCVILVSITHTVVTLYLDSLFSKPPFRRAHHFSLASVIYLVLVYSSSAYITWMTITLMDVCLWGTLLACVAVFLLTDAGRNVHRSSRIFSFFIILLMVTRPESIALCPAIIAIRWLQGAATRDMKTAAKAAFLPTGVYVALCAMLTLFRLSYFGFPLPNTYYAKVSPSFLYNLSEGIAYLQSFVNSSPIVALGVFMVLFVLSQQLVMFFTAPRTLRTYRECAGQLMYPSGLTSVLCAILLLIPIINGGDHFTWYRFYQPVYPLLLLSSLSIAGDLAIRVLSHSTLTSITRSQKAAAVAVSLCFFFIFLQTDINWVGLQERQPMGKEFKIAERGWETGKVFTGLFSHSPRLPSLGVIVAGAIKRTYPGEVLDLMGLNNIKMGHSLGDRKGMKNHAAFNKDVFYQQLPDVLNPGVETAVRGTEDPSLHSAYGQYLFLSTVLRNLLDDPQFFRLYAYCKVRPQGCQNCDYATGFFRKVFIEELQKQGLFDLDVAHKVMQ